MNQRPKAYMALTLALVLVAAAIPIQIVIMFGYMPWDIPQVLARIAPLNWAVASFALFQAALCLRASRLLWISMPLFIGLVAWNNWLVVEMGLNATPMQALIATLGFVALHAVLLERDARRVLFNSKLRWWLTPKRKKAQLRATLWPTVGGEMNASTLDISEGGAFVTTQEATWNPSSLMPIRSLTVGGRCSVRIKIDNHRLIACSAEIVRHQSTANGRPGGLGLRFVNMTQSERQMLADFIDLPESSVPSLPFSRAA